MRYVLIAVLTLILPTAASGHPGDGHGGLSAGFGHPLLGLDHLMAMLGVGFWAAHQGSFRHALGVCTAFLAAMLAGFATGLAQAPLQAVELGIIASLLITGVLVVGGRRLPLMAAAGLAGLFALFHGQAHGAEMATGLSAGAFAGGFALASTALLGTGASAAAVLARGHLRRPVERFAGGVLIASAVYLLVVV